jgi:hypothetical protein
VFLFKGGEPSGAPCDPTALHSFVGLDPEFVERVAAWMAGSTFAADLPKEGGYDIKTCFTRHSTRIDYDDTRFAYSYEETGTSVSSPPGGLFDNEVIRCVGLVASFDGKRSGGSVCEGLATNGDKRLTRFQYDSNNKLVREAVSGTGKYDGLTTSGTVRDAGPPVEIKTGTAQLCNLQAGTYKLK